MARLTWPTEDIVVQLAQPLPRELREMPQLATAAYSVELRSAGAPLGRVLARIVMKVPGQRAVEVPVQLDVRHFDGVVVASKVILRGQSLTAENLTVNRQDVTTLVGYCSSPEQLAGLKSKRVIGPSQVVRNTDVETESRSVEPPMVKRRSRVKTIANSGALTVSVVGEALQDGRSGEVIKIRNVDSNTIVHGRVLSATEVELTE